MICNTEHQQHVNMFLREVQHANNNELKQKVILFETEITQYNDLLQCLLNALQINDLQLSACIHLRKYVNRTGNIIPQLCTESLKLSFEGGCNASFARSLIADCYKKGNIQVKNFIVRTIKQTLESQFSISVIETARFVIEEDTSTTEGGCSDFFPIIIKIFQNTHDNEIIQSILQFLLVGSSTHPDFFSDYGNQLVIPLLQLSYSLNTNIKQNYALLLSSFLTAEPDHLSQHVDELIKSCSLFLEDSSEEVCSAANSLLASLSHAFKSQLQSYLTSFTTIILNRIDSFVNIYDNVIEDEPPLLHTLASTLDEISAEYHDEFIALVVNISKSLSWPTILYVIGSIVKGWLQKDLFCDVFGWVVQKIFIELKTGQPSSLSLWALQEMYIFLPVMLSSNNYEELIIYLLKGNVQTYSILLLETMIDDSKNGVVLQYINQILNWVINNLSIDTSGEISVLLVETITALIDRSPDLFYGNKQLFIVITRTFLNLIHRNKVISDRVIQNLSYGIPKFGSMALIGSELQLVNVVIDMIHSDDTRDQAAALQLLTSLIETTNQPVELIRTMQNVGGVVLCGLRSVDEEVVDQAFTLLGDILQKDPMTLATSYQPVVEQVLTKMQTGNLSIRLWAVGILIKSSPNGIENLFAPFVNVLIRLIEIATSASTKSKPFLKRNLCVCLGRIALRKPELIIPHITLICDELIDSLLEVGDNEARVVAVEGFGRIIANQPLCCKSALLSVVNVLLAERQITPSMTSFCNSVLQILKNTYNGDAYLMIWNSVV
ncbi:HEAT repeat domain containing protein [Entamoeba histolytica HM-1:IMSS-B]|nr:HEAT repeat domain containing protein [Entamoeba histolytica KU27]EMH76659.1 HEAT repeat domain containing protein [Entamoeba histolytica HM-1:IMSS-B]EMS17168.1 HEAT repeat domain containing protein [Entamoeba histolytica HM-3:IMSS]ENY64278.1 HEAT repeat domain containing protein [Entamoeba histolytica HM-1:IMSS-A]GAT92186.1 heat repeat domain containing protein [Entamoeba histolytica]